MKEKGKCDKVNSEVDLDSFFAERVTIIYTEAMVPFRLGKWYVSEG
jgi:hypothetical protein